MKCVMTTGLSLGKGSKFVHNSEVMGQGVYTCTSRCKQGKYLITEDAPWENKDIGYRY